MTDLLVPRPSPGAGSRRSRPLLVAVLLLPLVALGGGVAVAMQSGDARPVTSAAAPAIAVRDVGTAPFTFFTPSKATTCLLRHDRTASAECIVTGNTWSLPPKPADCEFDFGLSVAFSGSGSGLTCRSDTFYDPTADVIAYGTTIRSGELTCQVARTGVTCANTTTGERLTVARAAYRLS